MKECAHAECIPVFGAINFVSKCAVGSFAIAVEVTISISVSQNAEKKKWSPACPKLALKLRLLELVCFMVPSEGKTVLCSQIRRSLGRG